MCRYKADRRRSLSVDDRTGADYTPSSAAEALRTLESSASMLITVQTDDGHVLKRDRNSLLAVGAKRPKQ